MVFKNLVNNRVSSTDGPTKKDVLTGEAFTIGLVGLDTGQEFEPHPEPYEVLFFVLEGAGEFTTSEGTVELSDGDALYLESGERRGIQYKEPLAILGVQEAH